MEKVVNSYETLFIVNPTIGDDEVKATAEKFTALIAENGTLGEVNEWGKRKLAYEINDLTDGDYTLINFHADPTQIAELDRVLRITDAVVRHMIVSRDDQE